jgi:hypothetical protein
MQVNNKVMKSFVLWYMTPCCSLKSTDVSKEHFAFIITVEEKVKQETGVKASNKKSSVAS